MDLEKLGNCVMFGMTQQGGMMMKTIVLSAALLAGTSLGAFAQGCNSEHYAQPVAVQDQVAAVADESQVLTTGQISVAGVDCSATPDAAECLQSAVPATN